MITIILGNLGSSKTLCTVKYMQDNDHMNFYSNIHTTLPNQTDLNKDMIITKKKIGEKKKRSGETEIQYEKKLNIDFWKNVKKPVSVVIDEAHTIINSRNAMTTQNKLLTEWLALLRRVVGNDSIQEGELILITQLWHRLDIVARDMATMVKFHVCHWKRKCNKCRCQWSEDSEMPERPRKCPYCLSPSLSKNHFYAEVFHFRNMKDFEQYHYLQHRTFYRHYIIKELSRYFGLYNTLQWDNLFSSD